MHIKDIGKIDSEHVQAFLRVRIENRICYSTWKKETSHLGKPANALTLYNSAVALAAKRAGEIVTGTYDFRYNFAHNRFRQRTKGGYTAEQAHYLISREMGHHRPDITLHYLM